MKLLKELVSIVNRKRIEKVKLIDISLEDEPGSQFGRFYNAIRQNTIKSDTEAAGLLYESNSLDDRYRKLKSRFKKRMMNYLFFIDTNTSSYSDYAKAYQTCYKNLILSRILINHGARFTFEKLAKQTLNQAIKFDFNNILVPLISGLLTNYSLAGRKNEYKKLLIQFTERKTLLDAEYECDRLQEQIIISFIASNLRSEKLVEETTKNIQQIEKLYEKHKSYKIIFTYYYTLAIYYQLLNDFNKLIETCETAEQYYHDNSIFYQNTALAKFSLMKMPAYLNLRKKEAGLTALSKSLGYFTVGGNNWLMAMEVYFLIAMQAEHHILASELFMNAVNQPKFKYANPIRREKWKIFHAYLHYIFEVENLDKKLLRNKYIYGFKPETFLQNTPIASKDKTGMNIAMLVLQIQYLFMTGRIDEIFDKTDAMSTYGYRHLNKKENSRAYIYIKMLQMAEKRSFIYQYAKKATEKLHLQLRTEIDSYSAEWEVLPYDIMWDHALEYMKEND
jgi:hypothetical protein